MGLVAVFSSYPRFATIWNFWIPPLCPARKLGLMGKWMHPTEKDHGWISLTRGTYDVYQASPRIWKILLLPLSLQVMSCLPVLWWVFYPFLISCFRNSNRNWAKAHSIRPAKAKQPSNLFFREKSNLQKNKSERNTQKKAKKKELREVLKIIERKLT